MMRCPCTRLSWPPRSAGIRLRTLVTRGNLAICYYHLGRIDEARVCSERSTQGGRAE